MTNKRVFQALDFDRTIFRTRTMQQKLIDALALYRPGLEKEIEKESIAHGARGESFFIFQYLRERLGTVDFPDFMTQFRASTPVDALVKDGAHERLAYAFSQPGWSGGIMTYGAPEDQRMKLDMLDMAKYPHYITSTPDKGAIIASWLQPDGTFLLPDEYGGGVVDVVTLDDDKLRAFQGLPKQAYGMWLTKDAEALTQVPQELQDRVVPVKDLFESIDHLKNILT